MSCVTLKICLTINVLLKTKCMVHNWLNSLSVNEFEYMKNAVFNINIFLILQKGFNQHQPPETNRRPELGLKSEFQDQVSTRPPWGTPPTPSHTLACSFMGVGDSHLLWIWFCLRCLRIDWFAHLWENTRKMHKRCTLQSFICIFIYFINEIFCADSKFIAYLKPFVVYCNMFWKWQCFWEWV